MRLFQHRGRDLGIRRCGCWLLRRDMDTWDGCVGTGTGCNYINYVPRGGKGWYEGWL